MMKSLIRFAVSGGLATVTHVCVFVVLVEWFGMRPVMAAGLAFSIALIVSYGMNYHWTFSASGPHLRMLPRFMVVAFTGLGLNVSITYVVVDMAGYWYGYALLLVVTLVSLITFTLSKMWVFCEQKDKQEEK